MSTITMLGTGYATATHCYNTCFMIQEGETRLLVDAGGGNAILQQLQRVHVSLGDIHHMFLTHAHTDHVLGAVWMVRMIAQQAKLGKYEGQFHVYGHDKVVHVLEWICRNTLPASLIKYISSHVVMHTLTDGEAFTLNDWHLEAFDIHSTKEKQYGFRLTLADGRRIVCLGDEPYNEQNESFVRNADWLLCEAFCLYADRDTFHPYEKHHSTALDAARLAQSLNVKNLLLYHTEDKSLATRKTQYTAEARQAYSGHVFVPDDLESIQL